MTCKPCKPPVVWPWIVMGFLAVPFFAILDFARWVRRVGAWGVVGVFRDRDFCG
jgi:hypothetical protein